MVLSRPSSLYGAAAASSSTGGGGLYSLAQQRIQAPQGDDGGGGILGSGFGPDVKLPGIGGVTALKEIGGGITALLGMGWEALPDQLPGQSEGQPGNVDTLSLLGKGMAGSIAGTLDTLNPAVAIGTKLPGPIGDAAEHLSAGKFTGDLWGEQYEGKDFFEKAGERGIIPALVEDVGNIALVGSAVTAPIKGAAKVSRIGNKGVTSPTTAKLEAVHAGLINKPLIRAAQHPYKVSAQAIRSKYMKPALLETTGNPVANSRIAGVAEKYMDVHGEELGLGPRRQVRLDMEADPEVGRNLADAYAEVPDFDSLTPERRAEVEASYQSLVDTTQKQADILRENGVTFEAVDENPYQTYEEMVADVEQNGVLKVFKTKDGEHPFMTPEQNDTFRAVHDLFGHAEYGNTFSRHGEEGAFALHKQMYPEQAHGALVMETRAQNSALNFSEANVARKAAGKDPEFAEQRLGLLDEDVAQAGVEERYFDVDRNPGPVKQALARAEQRLQSRETMRLSRESERLAETARKRAARNPDVLAAVAAAKDLIAETGVTRPEASRIIGAELTARLDGTHALYDLAAERFPDLPASKVRKAINRGEGLPDDLDPGVRAQIEASLTTAVEEHLRVKERNYAELATSRKGVVGLENLDSNLPELTKKQQARHNRAMRYLEQADALEKQVLKEREVLKGRVRNADDQLGRLATRLQQNSQARAGAVEAFDHVRSLVPKVWRNAGAVARTAQELFEATIAEGGATFKPNVGATGQMLKMGDDTGYMVGVLPGTALEVPLAELTPQHIESVIADYQDLFQNPDVTIGTWTDEKGIVHIDPSEHIEINPARPHEAWVDALVKGGVRIQEAIADLGAGTTPEIPLRHRPDIADAFLKKGDRQSLNRFAKELFEVAEHTGLTEAEMVDMVSMNMTLAMSRVDAGVFTKPDDYFKSFETVAAVKGSTAEGVLHQLVKTFDPTDDASRAGMLKEVLSVVKDWRYAGKWYSESHEFVEQLRELPDVTLLDGVTKINPADLMYEFMAVTSFREMPDGNMRNAMDAMRLIVGPEGAAARKTMSATLRQVAENKLSLDDALAKLFPDTKANKRYEAFEATGGKDTTRFEYDRARARGKEAEKLEAAGPRDGLRGANIGNARQMLMAIMSGKTLQPRPEVGWHGWTKEFIDSEFRPAVGIKSKWAGGEGTGTGSDLLKEAGVKSDVEYVDVNHPDFDTSLVSEVAAGVDEAEALRRQKVREFHGSNTYTKILSFWDNLKNPSTSGAVTLDMWMSRLFGGADYGSDGSWAHLAQGVRKAAREFSEMTGENIDTAAMQAILWVYANNDIAQQRTGHFLAGSDELVDAIDAGVPIADAADPMLRYFEESREPYLSKAPKVEGQEAVREIATRERTVRRGSETTTEELNYLLEGVDDELSKVASLETTWRTAREKINKAIESDDLPKAHKIREEYTTKTTALLNKWGGYASTNNNFRDWVRMARNGESSPSLGRAVEQLEDVFGQTFEQRVNDKILGEFVPKGPEIRSAVRLFESGNFATIVHEQGHLMRHILSDAEMLTAEKAYKVKRGAEWTTEQHEAIANDFMTYMSRGEAPKHLEGTFAHVKAGLIEIWEGIKNTVLGRNISSDMREMFDTWLDPTVRPLGTPEGEIAGLAVPAAETGTIGQRTARPPKFGTSRTRPEYYHAGRGSAAARARIQMLDQRKQALEAAGQKWERTKTDLEDLLESGMTRSERKQQKYRDVAARRLGQLAGEQARPSLARTPAKWQPLYQAVQDLEKVAEGDPAIAALVSELPDLLPEIQALALKRGFDPTHVRQFTPSQVRRLVFGNLQLGLGREVTEQTGGFRKNRSGVLRSRGAVDESVEALIAATTEIALERRTNEVITHVEKTLARRLPAGEEIPDGWVAWSPTRTFLLTGAEVSAETGKIVETAGKSGDMIVPKHTMKMLRREAGDFSHPVFDTIGKLTSPWRTLVLTLSPGWYARNIVGNTIMATAEGVSLKDWANAWKSYRNTDEVGRFADMPEVTGDTLATEAGSSIDDSLIPRPRATRSDPLAGARAAVQEGGNTKLGKAKAALGYARDSMQRANSVVDEISRSAVYHKGKRLNMTDEQAWTRATEALVDYNNLSPFERKAVRAVVPFYSWQKGILNVTKKQAIDHPARVSVTMAMSQIQEEYVRDLLGIDGDGEVPEYYAHLVGSGRNIRSWNPFADTSEILTPEGIARSMNPFLEISVRKALGAPEFFPDQQRMGPFGTVEDDVNVNDELGQLLTGAPAGRAATGGAGHVATLGLGQQDIAKLRERIARSNEQLSPQVAP